MSTKKIIILSNDTPYTYNLRRELIERLAQDGHSVVVVCKLMSMKQELESLRCRLIDVDTGRHGTNPVTDLMLLRSYIRILKREKPDITLTFNIKPNIYGGMACRLLRIRYMPNITGLGTAVEYPGHMQRLTTFLYKIGIAGADCVFFQNEENEQFFRDRHMLSRHSRTCLLPGSGVNLQEHPPLPFPEGEKINFLFVARILKEKGIDLYLTAAKAIHERHGHVVFHICGMCDDKQYIDILKQAEDEGYIKYHGEQKDMTPFYQMAHCIVHPSYYPEGMSNVLLEAGASARPVIATDRSGCRETVENGLTGYLVPIKQEKSLIEALEAFLALSWEEKRAMGLAGRGKMEREFDRGMVVGQYLTELRKV